VTILKLIIVNILTVAVFMVLINWGCGAYLRRSDPQSGRELLPNYDSDRDHARQVFKDYYSVKHEYEPFVGWKSRPYQGKTLTISQEGERTYKQEIACGDQKSVHFFGGSTMWGEGADDAHTIPALFNKENPGYQVCNHGQLAYNSRQELDALISLYSKNINPDVVVFYDGVNDAAFLCPSEIKDLPAHRLVPMYREKLYAGQTAMLRQITTKLFLENILKVVTKFSSKQAEASQYNCIGSGKAEEIADIMMKNWELANEMVTARGGKFIAVLQPAAFIGKPRTDHLKLDEELGRNFSEVYKQIKVKIAEKKYPWIFDLSNSFDGDDYIYIDFCHVSPNGNEIIAKEISKLISNDDNSTIVSNLNN
jgi:hypothetical protein